ncbi:MAG: M61 family metallopeptidase [Crocinitomicaceae bacterium]|nr:M61 family metallopeptidase [Crocinitomicaceae bacterium]MBK9592180.1 M61 family metallopeptidase [Crocinitomicaceae bacterium]
MRKIIFLVLTLSYYSFTSLALEVNYQLGMSKPNTHYFQVEMNVSGITSPNLVVKMPAWAPGSYLIREFSKNVNMVYAKDEKGVSRDVKKLTKNSWQINTKDAKSISITYDVYAFELSVRTSFLDDSHGYLNGTSVFMYVEGNQNLKGKLTIIPHPTFKKISTSLKSEGNNVYSFSSYDELVDCPIEIGNQEIFHFEAGGVHHTVAMYGEGNYDIPTLQKDMARVIEAETKAMGENPNKEYVFIIHNVTDPSGGLEHKNSTTLEVNRWTYEGSDYLGFLSLVAHEYFHLWNVKRIRPKALGPFNYDEENYTDLLWVMEGFTSYYDELFLRRAGFYTQDEYLGKIMGTINYVENQTGNKVQCVAHSSFDAWIKAYRPTENSSNTTISYYSKGQILAAILDLHIINKFDATKCLDDFMQKLYKDFYLKKDVGFTEAEFQTSLEEFLGEDMDDFFTRFVYGTETPDYKKYFEAVGLFFYNSDDQVKPFLGARTTSSGSNVIITGITAGSPAEEYGLSVNDEILAINGYRMDQPAFDAFIKTLESGDTFEILVSRDSVLKTYQIKMGGKNTKKYMVKPDFNDTSQKKFDYWLRVDIDKH